MGLYQGKGHRLPTSSDKGCELKQTCKDLRQQELAIAGTKLKEKAAGSAFHLLHALQQRRHTITTSGKHDQKSTCRTGAHCTQVAGGKSYWLELVPVSIELKVG